MFKKLNIKILLIVFAALLVIVIVTNLGKDKKASSFDSQIVHADTADITSIVIIPKNNGSMLTFTKKKQGWYVSSDKGTYTADESQVRNILNTLATMKAKKLAARTKEKWAEFEVNDSTATRVQIKKGKKLIDEIYVGKFSYQQPTQPAANPYQQQRGIMTSYVRNADSKEVFAVDGFLSMTFGSAIEAYRNKLVLKTSKNDIQRIEFKLPEETFTLQKSGDNWMLNGLVPDSTALADYFKGIASLSSNYFVTENEVPTITPTHSLTIKTADGDILLNAYKATEGEVDKIAVTSTMNSGSYFDGVKAGLFEKLFKNQLYFMGNNEEI